jgi:hypothetical protein
VSRQNRIHLDASQPGMDRTAICGWFAVDTEVDLSKVTCKQCLARSRGETAAKTQRVAGPTPIGAAEMRTALAQALGNLEPKAGPPPVLTAPLWASTCKSAEHRRCGSCALCEWEREAERWAAVSPWTEKPAAKKPVGAATWPSLAAAFSALVDFEFHDRHGPSALGFILDRAKRGDISDGGRSRPDDPLMARAGDLVLLRKALELAFPVGAHALSQATRMRLLIERTKGALPEMPTYEALAAREGVDEGDLRALVKHGRRTVVVDLASRGLIPMPRAEDGLAEDVEAARRRFV